ncbi:MAG: tRNA uridine-5-carboxymethylaminomethyl(34) synthesis GTPase MnmE [Clostridia bacterium]|nr:tRNA uridine-5-carboxymethylaminomethyl(34) synthesis GTPase MnmE [Clostridia bacterium]
MFTTEFGTIAAISTPQGKGGVALVRISGPEANAVGDRIFKRINGKPVSESPVRTALFGEIVDPLNGHRIDTGLCTRFAAPNSFTGEDTVEICCHGGILVTRAVLGAALAAGARRAEAGEFTRRAFAAGKLSLNEAEALGMLLDAGTEAQLKLSRGGMSGALSTACDGLRREITTLLEDIYARVDFPEEDLGSIADEEVISRLSDLINSAKKLAATYSTGRAVAEGIPTVICGRTNAGKSTLYNLLVGSDEAIVTDIEGTTRDILTATVSFGGVTLLLSDTAGLRETAEEVERIGIRRAEEKIDSAELVLFLIDSSRAPSEDDVALAERLESHPGKVIAVLTKSDLDKNDDAIALASRFELKVTLSVKSGSGCDELEALVSRLFIDGELDTERDAVIASARQHDALVRVIDALSEAWSSLADGFPPDVAGVCLEDAAARLCELDGRGHGAVGADIADGIFSRFCVGK